MKNTYPTYEKNEIIQIPKTAFVEAREFYDKKVYAALANCEADGKRALFMPEVVDARIALPAQSRIWREWYCTPSVRVIGKTKRGNVVVVYAHVPNYFSDPKNIKDALPGLRHGFGEMPTKEFQELINLEDKVSVFVIDYAKFKKSSESQSSRHPSFRRYSVWLDVDDALNYPPTIAILGGEDRAEAYLKKYKQVYQKRRNNWIFGVDGLHELDSVPRARLISISEEPFLALYLHPLQAHGRFLGAGNLCIADNNDICHGDFVKHESQIEEESEWERELARTNLKR